MNGVNKILEKLKSYNMADMSDKDAVFQSAANILTHLFNDDIKIVASIINAQRDYDVDTMCSFIDIITSYLEVCKANLIRYGNKEN